MTTVNVLQANVVSILATHFPEMEGKASSELLNQLESCMTFMQERVNAEEMHEEFIAYCLDTMGADTINNIVKELKWVDGKVESTVTTETTMDLLAAWVDGNVPVNAISLSIVLYSALIEYLQPNAGVTHTELESFVATVLDTTKE